jgi:hypothetical protein
VKTFQPDPADSPPSIRHNVKNLTGTGHEDLEDSVEGQSRPIDQDLLGGVLGPVQLQRWQSAGPRRIVDARSSSSLACSARSPPRDAHGDECRIRAARAAKAST